MIPLSIIKACIYRLYSILLYFSYSVALWGLLSDTKLGKYVVQLILRRHLPGNFSQVIQAAAHVQGYQVATDVVVQPGLNVVE